MATRRPKCRSRLNQAKACSRPCAIQSADAAPITPESMNQEQRTLSSRAIGKTLGVLRHRPYLLFWAGALISNTGNWTENAAQSWAGTSQTVGNPQQRLLVEILHFADFCPDFLLALLAGGISDRVSRQVWLFFQHRYDCAAGGYL